MAQKKTLHTLRSIILAVIPAVTTEGTGTAAKVRGGRIVLGPTDDGGIVDLCQIAVKAEAFDGNAPEGFAEIEAEIVRMALDGVIVLSGIPGGYRLISREYFAAARAVAKAAQVDGKAARVNVANKLATARNARVLGLA